MKKLGLIINPVAGMGGRVGLKGSDGVEIQQLAKKLGAVPESQNKAYIALKEIIPLKDDIQLLTAPGEMGEYCARKAGFEPCVIGSIKEGFTTANDTVSIAKKMVDAGIDLLLFAGGDGTARNICEAIGEKIPVVGIPAGVKIHSAVYAINPRSAGQAARLYLSGNGVKVKEAEVMDIDEEAFRQGIVKAKLYGYLKVPELKPYLQNVKSGGYSEKAALAGIAMEVIAGMENDVLYIIGPGTTTRSIMDKLGLPNTLLGIDVVCNKQLIAKDVNEKELFELISGRKAKIVVTVIGGQGHIFGRGNQQLSPRIIKQIGKENIIVIATMDKLAKLMPAPLLVDTGDPDLDEALCGYIRVITGFGESVPYPVSS